MALLRECDYRWSLTMPLVNLAIMDLEAGDDEAALPVLEESLAVLRMHGDRRTQPSYLYYLAVIVGRLGDHTRVGDLLREGLELRRDIGALREVALCLIGVAERAVQGGDRRVAGRLLGAALRLRSDREIRRSPATAEAMRTIESACRVALGNAAYEALLAEGRRLSPDQAITLAFEATTAP